MFGDLKFNFNIFPVFVINIKSFFKNYAFLIYYLFYSKSFSLPSFSELIYSKELSLTFSSKIIYYKELSLPSFSELIYSKGFLLPSSSELIYSKGFLLPSSSELISKECLKHCYNESILQHFIIMLFPS